MQDLRGDAGITRAPAFARPRLNADSRAPNRRARLEVFVEAEILPRLLDSHPPGAPARACASQALDALVGALLAGDAEAVAVAFEQAAAASVSEGALMLDVLAPAARRLGAMWEEDACDFFAVSHALTRLQTLLARLKLRRPPRRRTAPAMLLLTAPGETHAFGADMAAELFRREGWQVERGDSTRIYRLSERPFAAVGVSCACARVRPALPAFLAAARALARPGKPALVVGGALFASQPALGGELGADFVAADPQATRRISMALLERQQL